MNDPFNEESRSSVKRSRRLKKQKEIELDGDIDGPDDAIQKLMVENLN